MSSVKCFSVAKQKKENEKLGDMNEKKNQSDPRQSLCAIPGPQPCLSGLGDIWKCLETFFGNQNWKDITGF